MCFPQRKPRLSRLGEGRTFQSLQIIPATTKDQPPRVSDSKFRCLTVNRELMSADVATQRTRAFGSWTQNKLWVTAAGSRGTSDTCDTIRWPKSMALIVSLFIFVSIVFFPFNAAVKTPWHAQKITHLPQRERDRHFANYIIIWPWLISDDRHTNMNILATRNKHAWRGR